MYTGKDERNVEKKKYTLNNGRKENAGQIIVLELNDKIHVYMKGREKKRIANSIQGKISRRHRDDMEGEGDGGALDLNANFLLLNSLTLKGQTRRVNFHHHVPESKDEQATTTTTTPTTTTTIVH